MILSGVYALQHENNCFQIVKYIVKYNRNWCIETSLTEIVKFSLQKFSFILFYWNHYKKLFFFKKVRNFRQLIRENRKLYILKAGTICCFKRAFKNFPTPITRNYNNFVLIALLNVLFFFFIFIPLPEAWDLRVEAMSEHYLYEKRDME